MISLSEEELLIYGFGSYFNGRAEYQDIDLLILHESIDKKSCTLAINLKEVLSTQLNLSHISILSKSEASQLSFIEKSNCILIGSVPSNAMHSGAKSIIDKIKSFHPAPQNNHGDQDI